MHNILELGLNLPIAHSFLGERKAVFFTMLPLLVALALSSFDNSVLDWSLVGYDLIAIVPNQQLPAPHPLELPRKVDVIRKEDKPCQIIDRLSELDWHLHQGGSTSPIDEKERSTISTLTLSPANCGSSANRSISPTAAAPPIEYPWTISISHPFDL